MVGIPKDYHLEPIKCLSDGLKTRLVFCEISLQNPHLLLFDEPTNAADMEMIDSMVEVFPCHMQYVHLLDKYFSSGGGYQELQRGRGGHLARLPTPAADRR